MSQRERLENILGFYLGSTIWAFPHTPSIGPAGKSTEACRCNRANSPLRLIIRAPCICISEAYRIRQADSMWEADCMWEAGYDLGAGCMWEADHMRETDGTRGQNESLN
jgi:hypothetical protein